MWLLLKHVEKVFDVDLGLSHFSEEHTHVEQRAGELHEVGLDEDEVAWSHRAVHNAIRCHEEVQGQASRVDHGLSDVQLRQRSLDDHSASLELVEQVGVAVFLVLLVREGLHCLVVHDRFIQRELCFLLRVFTLTDLHSALITECFAEVGVQRQRHEHVAKVLRPAIELEHGAEKGELDSNGGEKAEDEPHRALNRFDGPVDGEHSVFATCLVEVQVQRVQVLEGVVRNFAHAALDELSDEHHAVLLRSRR